MGSIKYQLCYDSLEFCLFIRMRVIYYRIYSIMSLFSSEYLVQSRIGFLQNNRFTHNIDFSCILHFDNYGIKRLHNEIEYNHLL